MSASPCTRFGACATPGQSISSRTTLQSAQKICTIELQRTTPRRAACRAPGLGLTPTLLARVPDDQVIDPHDEHCLQHLQHLQDEPLEKSGGIQHAFQHLRRGIKTRLHHDCEEFLDLRAQKNQLVTLKQAQRTQGWRPPDERFRCLKPRHWRWHQLHLRVRRPAVGHHPECLTRGPGHHKSRAIRLFVPMPDRCGVYP